MELLINIFQKSWQILLDSSAYVLIGILIAGMLQVILSPTFILNHLGSGRFKSVIKAALLGVPLPL